MPWLEDEELSWPDRADCATAPVGLSEKAARAARPICLMDVSMTERSSGFEFAKSDNRATPFGPCMEDYVAVCEPVFWDFHLQYRQRANL
jgi:hypothetical protein